MERIRKQETVVYKAELPRVEGGGLRGYRLQLDVFLAINSVQPETHMQIGFKTNRCRSLHHKMFNFRWMCK